MKLTKLKKNDLVMHSLMEEHEFVNEYHSDVYQTFQKCLLCGFERPRPREEPLTNEEMDQLSSFSELFRHGIVDADQALDGMSLPEIDPSVDTLTVYS